jgi:hypothetical protein
MLIAFTVAVVIIGFGVLLSPPFKDFRKLVGMPEELPGARYSNGAAEIINSNPEMAELFLTRVTHYYHAIFVILIYGTIALIVRQYGLNVDALNLMLLGTLMVVIGAITYSYIEHTFFWHGLFVAGLAVAFSASLLILFALLRLQGKSLLDWAIIVAGILLLGGALIGGWVGSSFIDHSTAESFLESKIQSRFNPDFAEENVVWRAMTGHLHAMIALSLALIFLISVKMLDVKPGRWTEISTYAVIFGETVMALASYAVWFFGKTAHLIITPAALTLIFGTLMLSFKTASYDIKSPNGVLNWCLKLGNIWIWAFVAIPGAIVAISLRKPRFFNPEFRAEVWDWAELAYNIGHWHILLVFWGTVLLLAYLTMTKSKIAALAGWITIAGLLLATSTINLYMLANPAQPYTPNPYNNFWLQYFVEPGLGLMTVGIILSYYLFLRTLKATLKAKLEN